VSRLGESVDDLRDSRKTRSAPRSISASKREYRGNHFANRRRAARLRHLGGLDSRIHRGALAAVLLELEQPHLRPAIDPLDGLIL